MSSEPKDVASVEGNKPETCPTCGGPCTRPEVAGAHGRPYESLVKGEVVAEGQIYDGGPQELAAGGILKIHPLKDDSVAWPVLVIRAARKENTRTGGKE